MTAEGGPSDVQVQAVEGLCADEAGRCQLAGTLAAQERELSLWRSVFGPESLDQLAHMVGCMYCTPICGHEEDRCSTYDGLKETP